MDVDTDNVEVQRSERVDNGFRYLKRLRPLNESPERMRELYEHIYAEDYSGDDIGKASPEVFIRQLFTQGSEHFTYGDTMYVSAINIIPEINADVHFCTWGEVTVQQVMQVEKEFLGYLFDAYRLHRVTAFVPAFNKKAIRFATLTGFRYEGELREIFRLKDHFYNMQVYGILRAEFHR
jgi:hypothetical protein